MLEIFQGREKSKRKHDRLKTLKDYESLLKPSDGVMKNGEKSKNLTASQQLGQSGRSRGLRMIGGVEAGGLDRVWLLRLIVHRGGHRALARFGVSRVPGHFRHRLWNEKQNKNPRSINFKD